MILYITGDDKQNLLDRATESKELTLKKLRFNDINIKYFLINEAQSFNHYTDIVLDRDIIINGNDELIETIESSMLKDKFRFSVIDYNLSEDTELFNQFLSIGVYNLLFKRNIEEMLSEIDEALGMGIKRYRTMSRIMRNELIFDDISNIKIAVQKAHIRAGATYLSNNICNFIKREGGYAKLFTTENDANKVLDFQKKEGKEVNPHFVFYDDIDTEADYYILIGDINSIKYATMTVQKLKNMKQKNFYLIGNFVSDEAIDSFKEHIVKPLGIKHFYALKPDFNSLTDINDEMYKEIIKSIIYPESIEK